MLFVAEKYFLLLIYLNVQVSSEKLYLDDIIFRHFVNKLRCRPDEQTDRLLSPSLSETVDVVN